MRSATVACAVLLLASTACAYHPDNAVVQIANAGRCVPVDIAAAPATAKLLTVAAANFNGSAAARLPNRACAFVRVETVDSPVALRELTASWPDAATLGPAPAAWVPGSSMWGELLDARLADRRLPPIAPAGTPFARTPLVIAMPAPMARALGYPRHPLSWNDLASLAVDPRGWGAYGHPEWGPFRLGKGNPNWSTTGLDQTIALAASRDGAPAARTLEPSVVYYSDSTDAYLDNWRRLAATSTASALRYLSAAVTDERSVVKYDEGHAQKDESLDAHATSAALPLVPIYPSAAAIDSDNPIIVLRAAWTSAAAQAGARLFTEFALRPATQAKVAAAGFRPARGTVRTDLLKPAFGVDLTARTDSVEPATPAAIERALDTWQTDRRPGRVLVLFDVSDSMGDHLPGIVNGPTKMAVAQAALRTALDQLGRRDEVGLRIFTTKLSNPISSDWRDLVPIQPLTRDRPALDAAIATLAPEQGSPLYTATRAAFDTIARAADPSRINGVVVLTDGYNEQDDNNLRALLSHLGAGTGTRVFTIAYSVQADVPSLTKIAQVTNAWTYDATDPLDLPDVFARALANF